jgi:hypothetical protein
MRRVLLTLVLGMVVLTLLASLSAPSEETDDRPAPPPASGAPAAESTTLSFRHPAPTSVPVRRVRAGARVVVRVATKVPGEAEIQSLGLLEPAGPADPACSTCWRAAQAATTSCSSPWTATRPGWAR